MPSIVILQLLLQQLQQEEQEDPGELPQRELRLQTFSSSLWLAPEDLQELHAGNMELPTMEITLSWAGTTGSEPLQVVWGVVRGEEVADSGVIIHGEASAFLKQVAEVVEQLEDTFQDHEYPDIVDEDHLQQDDHLLQL